MNITPGPWNLTPGFDVRGTTSENRFVASVFGRGKEEKEANGRLIAAAPELLQALKDLKTDIEINDGEVPEYVIDIISKAEGTNQ